MPQAPKATIWFYKVLTWHVTIIASGPYAVACFTQLSIRSIVFLESV